MIATQGDPIPQKDTDACSPTLLSSVLRTNGLLNLLVIALCFAAFGCLMLLLVSKIIFFKSTVVNVSDATFFEVRHPAGFIAQDALSSRLREFRRQITSAGEYPPCLRSAVDIRHWVRRQQPDGESWRPHIITFRERLQGDLEDPLLILAAQRDGAPAVCRRFSYLLVGAIESIGMQARLVIVSHDYYKSYVDAEVMTEIWIPELGHWVLMDAMPDVMYTVSDSPASALDVYDAVRTRQTARIKIIGYGGATRPVDERLTQREFKHVYIALTNALFDGYRVCFSCRKPISFAHLTTSYSPDYPSSQKKVALAASGIGLLFGLLSLTIFGVRLRTQHASPYALSAACAAFTAAPMVATASPPGTTSTE